jgi:hypothetical protein
VPPSIISGEVVANEVLKAIQQQEHTPKRWKRFLMM